MIDGVVAIEPFRRGVKMKFISGFYGIFTKIL